VAGDGTVYALRFHRPGYRGDAQLQSELSWMAALAAGGLEVPRPIASRSGQFIESIDGYQVDVLTWLAGRPLGAAGVPLSLADRPGAFHALGAALARLHEISDAWVPPARFDRPKWDIAGLTGEDPLWGRFWQNPAVSRDERDILLQARDAAQHDLLAQRELLDYGLIHADAVRENVLIDGASARLIDFDDSGWGYRLFDVATALLKNRNEPDYATLEAALLDGYASHRVLDTRALPLFMMLRALTYLGWIIPRLGEPGAAERNQRNLGPALELADRYLGSRLRPA
jgi:Ser/Thr protein kinase RdoA (MazF antagonist)